MKKILFVVTALCAFANCSKQPSFTINGEVAGIEGKAVLLYEAPVSKIKVSDTVTVENGKFVFKGSVEEVVSAKVEIIPDNGDKAYCGIYLENAPLDVILDWNSLEDQGRYGKYIADVEVKGGPNNEFLEGYGAVGEKVLAQEKYKAYKAAQDKKDKYYSEENHKPGCINPFWGKTVVIYIHHHFSDGGRYKYKGTNRKNNGGYGKDSRALSFSAFGKYCYGQGKKQIYNRNDT